MFPSRPGGKQVVHLKTLPESSCDFWSHLQAAHCGRSSRFYTWPRVYPFLWCAARVLLAEPNQKPKGKETPWHSRPYRSAFPGKSKVEKDGGRLWGERGTNHIQALYLYVNDRHSIATTCFHECLPPGLWPCHHYLHSLCPWKRVWTEESLSKWFLN